MSKIIISKLFLYKHRFLIGYIILSLLFIGIIFSLPLLAPNGLNQSEITSATASVNTSVSSILSGNIIDLPYHLLQKASIKLFGLSIYSIKLPSIIIGVLSGFFLSLLLNRWFKNNVAIISSALAILSSVFLFISGFGTPLIMIVFWPIILLWLGSKIQSKGKIQPLLCFVFAFTLLLSIFTPFIPFLAIFILIYILFNPHLRFTIFNLPRIPLILGSIIVISGVGTLLFVLIKNNLLGSLLINEFSPSHFLNNLKTAIQPFLSWNNTIDDLFLSPLINLASLSLALIGLVSTTKGFLASRNSVATLFIIYTIFISGLEPKASVLMILPITILIAHGIRHILSRWYAIFPENPYARVFVVIPLSIFIGIITISDLSHYISNYFYNPAVANHFNSDLHLVKKYIPENTTLVIENNQALLNFYQIATKDQTFKVSSHLPDTPNTKIASLGKLEHKNLELNRIITSPKTSNSDRIYLYTVK